MPVGVSNRPTVNPDVGINRPEARAPAGENQVARVSSQPGSVTAAGNSPLSLDGLNTGPQSLRELALGALVDSLLPPGVGGLPDDAVPGRDATAGAGADGADGAAGLDFRSAATMGLAGVEAHGAGPAGLEALLAEQLTGDPNTERALTERQALSARAGQEVLADAISALEKHGTDGINNSETVREAVGGPLYFGARYHPSKLDKAAQLLADVAGGRHAGDAEPVYTPAAGEKNKDIKKHTQEAMAAYLGVKKPSKGQKAAAIRDFTAKVDRFLDARDVPAAPPAPARGVPLSILRKSAAQSGPPPLVGPDHSPSGVLTPDEKVALFIARSVGKSIDIDKLPDTPPHLVKSSLKPLSDPKQVRKQVADSVRQELRGRFEPITKSVTVAAPGQPAQTYKSELTPARAQGPGFGKQGVLCSDAHSADHLTNLWSTRYQSPGGKALFNGVRHGTVSAYGINPGHLRKLPKNELHALIRNHLPEQQRAGRSIEHIAKKLTSRFSVEGMRLRDAIRGQATANRARELVKFNLLNNPEAMVHVRGNVSTVDLEIPSIMLVTPDKLRRSLGVFGMKHEFDELRMTREQDKALKALAQAPVEVEVDTEAGPRTVRVNVKPLNFSFGVNSLALSKSPVPLWGAADAINSGSIERLIGAETGPSGEPATGLVADYLKGTADGLDPNVTEQDRKVVAQLADQVRELWQAKAHHRQNNDPYALPARLALLTHKLGLTPAYNCKSGKDRTGQLDMEIKFLATCIERDGQAPRPGAELDARDQELYRNVALNAGNHEIQQLNTGVAGYKVKLSSITKRLGGLVNQLKHMGQSKYTSA